jgi:hypothetical protein
MSAATDDQFGTEFDKTPPIEAPSPEPPPVTRIVCRPAILVQTSIAPWDAGEANQIVACH